MTHVILDVILTHVILTHVILDNTQIPVAAPGEMTNNNIKKLFVKVVKMFFLYWPMLFKTFTSRDCVKPKTV